MPNYGLGGVKAIMESPRRDMVVDPAHIPPPGILVITDGAAFQNRTRRSRLLPWLVEPEIFIKTR